MEKKYVELLRQFQRDSIRRAEESFAQALTENEKVRLFFVNEHQAFTDGTNVIVDPALKELFTDKDALDIAADFLQWPRVVFADPWNALKIITRGQTIHECLHILYTDMPGRQFSDPDCDTRNKKRVMTSISNIIEDSYIEAAGCSCFDNMEFFLQFHRVAGIFARKRVAGTVARTFADFLPPKDETKKERTNGEKLTDYLDYMVGMLLYPMFPLEKPEEDIKAYVDATRQFFWDGSAAPSPAERYEYCSKIFNVIKELIPEDSEELDTEFLESVLGGMKTHEGNNSPSGEKHEGRSQEITVRLFADKSGKPRENTVPLEQLMKALADFAKEKGQTVKVELYEGSHSEFHGSDIKASVVHKNIKINENRPKIELSLRRAYQNIYNRYKVNINSYNSRFSQILHDHVTQREEKFTFGSGISSKRLADPRKRYWYRNMDGIDVPDMAVMLLIDGSGSMEGGRREAAMHSAVILHEVLKKQNVPHAIVEHRAVWDKEEVDANILVGFNAREEEKYNILQLDADANSRDGLMMYWAERYLEKNVQNEHKLLIVISDGEPCHHVDEYFPPVSTRDTAEAVKKISRRGVEVVAIALDETGDYSCYNALKDIYPHLIACDDLNHLTGKLLGIIAKIINRG